MRPMPGEAASVTATTMLRAEAPKTVMMTTNSTISGKERMRSLTRLMTLSMRPP